MLGKLEYLQDYAYYFQFTLTGYGRDIEPNLPNKRKELIPAFQKLSEKIGKSLPGLYRIRKAPGEEPQSA